MSDEEESIDLAPYSLPSVRELFRVLINFLDPHNRQYTDTMRVMAMRIIHVAFEVAGPFIARHPALAVIAEDRLCCYLFQLVRSDNMAVLQESLIVAGTLLADEDEAANDTADIAKTDHEGDAHGTLLGAGKVVDSPSVGTGNL